MDDFEMSWRQLIIGQDVYSPAFDHGKMDAHTKSLNEENASPMNVNNVSTPSKAVVNPQDLVGQTFLMDEHDDGQCFHAKVVECIHDHKSAKTSHGSYGDWHFGIHVCVTCDIKQNSQKNK